MQYFPLFLDLNHKPVLVIGGGEVATRKVEMLMRAGAWVTIVSPKIDQQLRQWVEEEQCQWVQNFYSSELLSNEFVQLWATTNNPTINHQIYKDAKALGIWVNVVDDLPFCDFITPSVINRGKIQIAISSGGGSPVLVRKIRQTVESLLAQNITLLADFAASKRSAVKEHYPTVTERKRFWERFFEHAMVDNSNSWDQLESIYQSVVQQNEQEVYPMAWIEFGDDVELLTLKALQQMQKADLVYYPKDCPYEFVDLVRRDANKKVFSDAVELASILQQNENSTDRVCVFIPSLSSEYNLLTGTGNCFKLGQVK